uniref:Neurexin-1a n=1 Tax=Heterorhabditis bacteriophora TaxID=37862 RepID=A0A1I7WCQ3_HETBA
MQMMHNFRLGDNANDIDSRRTVNTIRIEEIRVDDDRWHTLSLFQSWENVKLELDYTLVFKILNQRSFIFGNILKNSDVFVGGVPPDIHQLPLMSSPLKRYARHLAANIRNLVYRLYPQGVTSPQLIDVHGARQNEDDYCRPSSYASRELFVCHNDGHCLNTNEGPKCECSQSDHEGKHCDVEKLDGELTFAGQEWVGYDVVPKISGPIRIKRENVTLSFKTVHGSAMLFTAGDEKVRNYLSLIMEDGALIASSKFEGTDRRMIRMFNSISGERYDDDLWHTVVLERSLQMPNTTVCYRVDWVRKVYRSFQMTLTVDGRRDEIRQYAPDLDWIINAFSYLGGVPKDKSIQEINQKFFRGCMKKAIKSLITLLILYSKIKNVFVTKNVRSNLLRVQIYTYIDMFIQVKYEADAHLILFLNLADQGYGESIIRTGGELSFSCKSPFNPPDVLSFTSGRSYLPLPKWGALASGSLSFHFRTVEPDGLILYHGNMATNSSDYIAFELIDGHLHMVINLGSGVVRLQTTAQKVTDGTQWHNVYLERVGRTGSVVVDNVKTDFNTPGVSSNFIVVLFFFVLKDILISYFSLIFTSEITIGCPNTQQVDHCERNPCHNFGRCENRQNTYKCDCAATNKEGPACNIEPTPVELDEEQILHILPHTIYSEAESIEIRFKTDVDHGVLLATKSNSKPNNRLMIHLNNSALEVLLENENGRNMFKWGNSLSDNQWHLLRMKRRGDKVLLFLDGKWEQNIAFLLSDFLPTSVVLAMDEVVGGRAMDSMTESFKGFVSSMMFNEMDLLESKKYGKTNKDGKGQRNIKSKISSVSFMNTTGYLVYSSSMIKTLSGSFRISFKFQTLARSAILFATFPSDNSDSITIELFNGRIRYTYKSLNGEQSVISPKLRNSQHLSDMRWHTLLLYQDEKTQDHMLLVDNTTTVMNCIGKAELVGVALLGGVPPYLRSSQSILWKGYRGCIANYKLNDRLIDALEESEANSSVVKGCMGPIARCSLSACANQGRCIQQWSSIRCECSLTAYSGDRCQDAATTVVFRGEFSAIFYEYPLGERPSTSRDYLVMAFKTTQSSGVLYSIECTADQDYLTLYIQNGYIQVKYNLGSRDHHFGYFVQPLNDGEKHRIRLHREEANMTLQVDGKTPIRYRPRGEWQRFIQKKTAILKIKILTKHNILLVLQLHLELFY